MDQLYLINQNDETVILQIQDIVSKSFHYHQINSGKRTDETKINPIRSVGQRAKVFYNIAGYPRKCLIPAE